MLLPPSVPRSVFQEVLPPELATRQWEKVGVDGVSVPVTLKTEADEVSVEPFTELFQMMQLVRMGEERLLKIAPPRLAAELLWKEQLVRGGEELML